MTVNVKIIDKGFDKNLFNSKASHPLQSWEWGEAREKMGITVIRLGEYKGHSLNNVYTITYHNIPNTPFCIAYLPRSVVPSKEVLEFLMKEGRKKRVLFIKIEPYVKKNEENIRLDVLTQYARRSAHPLFPEWTQTLDLVQSESEILKNMKSKTRYNVGLAEKRGVVVKEMTNDEGFKIFIELYFKTTKRQGYKGHNKKYHHIIFEMLKDTMSHILIAYYQDKPLAAYHIFIFNDVLYYPYGGSSDEYKNLMASNLLMWEAIKFGKKAGCKIFDMWGSLPPDYDRSAPWSGFTRFKEGYGTEFSEFVGSYDVVLRSLFYRVYSVMYTIRKRVL